MWRLVLLVITVLSAEVSSGQYLSLSGEEMENLKIKIKYDTAVRNICNGILKKADDAKKAVPNPIVNLSTAGRLRGDSIREQSVKSIKDFDKIWCFAFAYSFTNRDEYLVKLETFLLLWADINIANGEPINETKLEPLLEGYDVVRNKMNKQSTEKIDAWLHSIAEMETNKDEFKILKKYNNINSHRIKIVGMIGVLLNNREFVKYAEDELIKQIENNLYTDGSSFDFLERDALHYHCYTLEPLLRLSIALNRFNGKNYFNYTSSKNTSLKKSVDFLIPYLTREKRHQEYVNSRVNFDKVRSANGQDNYRTGRTFDPKEGVLVIELTSFFDSHYLLNLATYQFPVNRNNSFRMILNELSQ